MALQTIWQAISGTLLSKVGAVVDGSSQNVTTDNYGRVMTVPITSSDVGAAIEGSYFVGTMGVAGSGAAVTVGPASSVPADIVPFLLIMNQNQPGGASIWLKRVFCLMSSTQTSETLMTVQGQLDQGLLYTSGGTALTFKNSNPAAGRASGAVGYVGTIAKPVKTTAVIYCARSNPRSTIPVAGDEYIWKFGATQGPSSFISSTAGATRQVIDHGPVVIPPQWTFSMHVAWGATSGGTPTFEIETGHIER